MVQPLMRPEDMVPDPDAPDENNLLSLFAKFNFSIDRLNANLEKAFRLEQARLAVLPNPIVFSQMAQLTGAQVYDFNGPQPGRKWVVRLLAALPSPIIASGPPLVTWYVGQNMPGPAAGQLPATMARWQFSAVPAFQTFSADLIQVMPGERLLAGVTSAPANTVLALSVGINDQPLNAVMPVTIE